MNSLGTGSLDPFFSSNFCISKRKTLQGFGTHLQTIFQNCQYWHNSIPIEASMLWTELDQLIILNDNKAKAAPTAVLNLPQMQKSINLQRTWQ